jgi:hypothetical protein
VPNEKHFSLPNAGELPYYTVIPDGEFPVRDSVHFRCIKFTRFTPEEDRTMDQKYTIPG